MFGRKSSENIVRKSITRKYKNAKITLLDAQFSNKDNTEIALDEEKVDKLFRDINRAVEGNSSKYNPSSKTIIIANDKTYIDNLNSKPGEERIYEEIGKVNSEICDIYEPKYTMDDVYLEENEKKQIMNALNIKKYEKKIYEEWGLKDTLKTTHSVALNFFGPPGTGKSMVAEAIASFLEKKVYLINYAQLESKYVGETSKNIKNAFDRAKNENAVLIFDEADSFLGKRITNVTQSVDYGINITRSVMLMELEKFDGVVIFTTNLLVNYDEAFKRRIITSVGFKLPDETGRKEIFDRHISKKMPLDEDVNSERLAKEFEDVSGSDIKDIVFMAAINAMDREDEKVIFDDFVQAYKTIKNRYI